jgi:hypothetical protein
MVFRLFKLLIISLVIIFLIATGFSLMIPSHIRISKAINIHGQVDSILSLVADKDRWPEWHPAYLPGDSTPRFQEIHSTIQSRSDSEVVMQLQQGSKDPVVNGWKTFQHQQVDSVTLQWYMDFHLKWYPWKKFGSLFYENTYGVMMEKGLTNIKKLTEK